jgi:hypothetical protein
MDDAQIKDLVRARYGGIARGGRRKLLRARGFVVLRSGDGLAR